MTKEYKDITVAQIRRKTFFKALGLTEGSKNETAHRHEKRLKDKQGLILVLKIEIAVTYEYGQD